MSNNVFITHIKTNLNGVLQMTEMIDGIMMTGDDKANQIVVELHRDREPYIIPAGTKIVGYFIRSDGYTLEISGEVTEEGNARIFIPALAYQVPGALSIAIRMFVDPYQEEQRGYYSSTAEEFVIVNDPSVTEGPNGEPIIIRTVTLYANKTVIATASCFVQMTETDSIIEPGHEIPDINDVIAKLAELDQTEYARQLAESGRVEAESGRVAAEAARVSAESARVNAESDRAQAETARAQAESSRADAETTRIANENERIQAETARVAAETARDTAETTRETNDAARQYAIDNMTVSAVSLPYDAEPTATITTVSGAKHIQFGLVPGKPFRIKKTFASVAEMESYTGTDVELYEFVVITSNVQDPDNSKMYMKIQAPDNWFFITDLSGAQGIQGPQGIQGIQGVSISSVTLNQDYTLTIRYSNSTTTTTSSIRGEKGETGVSISNVIHNQDYTLTIMFSDGTFVKTNSIRGEKGETGTSISGVVQNADYTLTILFDDGTSWTTPASVRGQQGIQGETGPIGPGIDHVEVNDDYTMTYYLVNGTTYTTPFSMRGPKGEPGYGGAEVEYDAEDSTVTIMFG